MNNYVVLLSKNNKHYFYVVYQNGKNSIAIFDNIDTIIKELVVDIATTQHGSVVGHMLNLGGYDVRVASIEFDDIDSIVSEYLMLRDGSAVITQQQTAGGTIRLVRVRENSIQKFLSNKKLPLIRDTRNGKDELGLL